MSLRSLVLVLTCTLPLSAVARGHRTGPSPHKVPAVARDAARLEARTFLETYNSVYARLVTVAQNHAWRASTDVSEAHDARRVASGQALSAFLGDRAVIATTRSLLARKALLEPLQVRQLEKVLLNASAAPGTLPDVVDALVEADSRQSSTLDGFAFCLRKGDDGRCAQPTSPNVIDERLRTSRDLAERRAHWEASKESGRALKPGLVELQRLRNQVAREMGFSSYFALQVADYGMAVPEMMALLDSFVADTRPLYDAIHRWARRTMARRYGAPVPQGPTPAHWFPNRWAQGWGGLVDGVDLEPYFKPRTKEWIVQQAERFYTSIGMEPLPPSFWAKSDLYALPPGSPRKKNTHASAWNVDFGKDVRSLMSVEPSQEWFGTAHHELGHIYYYLAYNRPEVPPVLREGANRAFHEAIGDLIFIAASQEPYLREQGILPPEAKLDRDQLLLDEALGETVAFIPWSAGVMSRFEYELYEHDLPPERWQSTWWELVRRYQDVAPPDAARLADPALCDACTKTHVNDDPAQYYDYALAAVIKYQLHEHIATRLLKQDPHACSYFGHKEVGEFLVRILREGATRDWRTVLEEATGERLSTRAMRAYFEPLKAYLAREEARP
jgi:peptidyl-dipeptidase A